MKKLLTILTLTILFFKPFEPPITTAQEKRMTINDFSGGLNTKMSSNQLPKNQCSSCHDVLFDEKPGSIVSRGEAEAGYTVIDSTDARELFAFERNNGQLYLIKHYQGKVHYTVDEGETWHDTNLDLNWEQNWLRGAIYDNKWIFVNGSDKSGVFDGNIAAQYDFMPRGRVIISDKNRVFIGGVPGDPNKLYYNNPLEEIDTEEAWDDLNYEFIGTETGDAITGLATFRDQLVIFKKYSTWVLLGEHPATWRIRRISGNYGCLHQESIANDKNLLKFLSHAGVKAYNGSSVIDIDSPIEDRILASNNISGDYNYLRFTDLQDFEIENATETISRGSDLGLITYETSWEGEDLNSNLTNIDYNDGMLILSTTTTPSLTTEEQSQEMGDWTVTRGNWQAEYNIDDGDEDTRAKNTKGGYTQKRYDVETSFTEDISNIDSVSFDVDIKYKNKVYYKGNKDDKHSDVADNILDIELPNDVQRVKVYYRIKITDTNLDKYNLTGWNKILQINNGKANARHLETYRWPKVMWGEYYNEVTAEWGSTVKGKRQISKSLKNLSSPSSKDTVSMEIQFKVKNDYRRHNFDPEGILETMEEHERDYGFKLNKIYDITVKYRTQDQIFESTGSFETASKKIDDFEVQFGSLTISEDAYDNKHTTMTLYTNSSQDDVTYEGWKKVDIDTRTWEGMIQSAAGKYLKVKGDFETYYTSYTPMLGGITAESINSTGAVTFSKFNAYKTDGGWNEFIANDEGDTINYYVKLATGHDALDDKSFNQITDGEDIDGITGSSTQTWIQPRIYFENSDGGILPKPLVYGMVFKYTPNSAPTYANAVSWQDRYHIATSSSGDTNNSTIYVHDKNNAWTRYNIDVIDFCEFGRKLLFSNSDGIYHLYNSTEDAGSPITAKWKKNLMFDYSYDISLNAISSVGQNQGTAGALDIKYQMENTTNTYTASNIDTGDSGIFRSLQRDCFNKSPVSHWWITYTSTAPFEINATDLFIEQEELRPQ